MAGMVRAGQHDQLRLTFGRLHRDSHRGLIESMLVLLNNEEPAERWVDKLVAWSRADGGTAARTVLIYGLIKHAWLTHGEKLGRDLSGEQLAVFHDLLNEAERLLEKAIALQPDHADLLLLRLTTARGLSLPLEEHWTRFRALQAIAPLHYPGHLSMLENLKAKWGGSDDAMFRFARARASQVPEGSPIHSLIVHAHFEIHGRLLATADHDADQYFHQAGVGDEIEAAWSQSLGSPAFRDENNAEGLSNLFAAALFLAGRFDAARAALSVMDGYCTAAPWGALARTPKEKANVGWVVDRFAQVLPAA